MELASSSTSKSYISDNSTSAFPFLLIKRCRQHRTPVRLLLELPLLQELHIRLASEGISVGLFDLPNQETLLQDLVKKIEGFGDVKAISITGDVSVEEDIKSAIEKVVEVLGDLDIMVANAGIAPLASIMDMTNKEWKRVQSINLDGTMYCYKHAALQMIKQGHGGRIIGALSLAGKKALPNCCAYSTSKFAIRGLTQSAALDLQPYNITVNTYAPGHIDTPLVRSGVEKIPAHLRPPSAKPDVVAALVAYLVKPEAYFVTGQSISIDDIKSEVPKLSSSSEH
ncbi:short-chain dehydrogenases/reductases (SDR) family protein [Abortiporus biennis]